MSMFEGKTRKFSRRDFIRLAGGAAMAGPFFLFPGRARAQSSTLKIAHWPHLVPDYDQWFAGFAEQWGKKHETQVLVDSIPVDKIHSQAAAEVAAGKGHDLFLFPAPPATYHEHVIDHSEVYQSVAVRHGVLSKFAHKATFNPRTRKYFAFCDSWIPALLHFFQDDWAEANMPLGPPTWDSLLSGGKRVRAKTGVPCGLALSPGLEGSVTAQAILWGSRAFVQNPSGTFEFNPILTTRALEYAKALYQESETPEALTWGPSGNARAMLARQTSCTLNAISLVRAAEREEPQLARKMLLQPPLLGMAKVIGPPHATNCWVIWNFAENKDGAKQFLTDFVDNSKTAYEQSLGCNFPTYQNTLPDLIVRLSNDSMADPAWKYQTLKDALYWTRNIGFPGFATPAAMEVFDTNVFPRVFAGVLRGEMSAEDGAHAAERQVKGIFEKWKQV